MEQQEMKGAVRKRRGEVRRRDVVRWLAELARGKVNDCVRLVLEKDPDLGKLDLRLLSEVKRNDKGAVEIKLINRLQVLEQLAAVTDREEDGLDAFLLAQRDGGEE